MNGDVPTSPEALRDLLATLRQEREERKVQVGKRSRRSLNVRDRELVLAKTATRCHICGGEIEGRWQADHVLAHSGGGHGERDNYLAAHALCNNYRWDYLPLEFQIILKLGVWARTQIEADTPLGREIASRVVAHEARRASRRKG